MQLDMFAQPPQRRTSLESVVRESLSRAAADSLDIGRALTRQRASLGDDNFLKWVRDKLGMSMAAADEYQRLAEIYPDASAVPADALGDLVAAILPTPESVHEANIRAMDAAMAMADEAEASGDPEAIKRALDALRAAIDKTDADISAARGGR